jgi:nucleoside-diphosphate-sugar epimerase
MAIKKLFCFGLGYSAQYIARDCIKAGFTVVGTTRTEDNRARLLQHGFTDIVLFDGKTSIPHFLEEHSDTTHLLCSLPANTQGDAAFLHHHAAINALPHLTWVGYLSTTGVYGDHQGDWVTEDTPVAPISPRGQHRVIAENQWLSLNIPANIFRLAGIYGKGRSALERVQEGSAQRIYKEGHVFSRIHVEDIAHIVCASMKSNLNGRIYNCADDDPAPPQDVIAYAANLLGMPVPPLIPYEQAILSDMAQSFYAECKRVDNTRIKEELGVVLRYPTYKEGLAGRRTFLLQPTNKFLSSLPI